MAWIPSSLIITCMAVSFVEIVSSQTNHWAAIVRGQGHACAQNCFELVVPLTRLRELELGLGRVRGICAQLTSMPLDFASSVRAFLILSTVYSVVIRSSVVEVKTWQAHEGEAG